MYIHIIKRNVNTDIYMANDFKRVTDQLFTCLGADDLAEKIGCSVQSVRQARMDVGATSYRTAPAGWRAAARTLALAQSAYFAMLAAKLKD